MEKCLIYTRVSSQQQVESGVSLEAQSAKCKAYASLHDLVIVEAIEDAGYSGKSLSRPGIGRLISLLEKGEAEHIIVYSLSRLSRKLTDLLMLVETFSKHSISFHSLTENVDTSSSMGMFFLQIMGSLAQLERSLIADRTRDGLRHLKQNGYKTGGSVPQFYQVDEERKLVQSPQGRYAVDQIVSLRDKGTSYRRIAQTLFDAGYTSKPLHPQSVKNILDFHQGRKCQASVKG
jgi:site-specific DNA recombinase